MNVNAVFYWREKQSLFNFIYENIESEWMFLKNAKCVFFFSSWGESQKN